MNQPPIPVQLYTPPLYRYLNEQYVDMFFDLGLLRISSFEQFKKHKDEARLDKDEGIANLTGTCSDKNTKVVIRYGVANSFVFCSSFEQSKDIADMFGTNSCFEIFSPIDFMIKIGESLEKNNYPLRRILYGFCNYKQTREIHKNISQKDMEKIHPLTDIGEIFRLGNKIAQDELFFLKSKDFIRQSEYRMVWDINSNNIPEYIDIYVPEAVQFCRKIKF